MPNPGVPGEKESYGKDVVVRELSPEDILGSENPFNRPETAVQEVRHGQRQEQTRHAVRETERDERRDVDDVTKHRGHQDGWVDEVVEASSQQNGLSCVQKTNLCFNSNLDVCKSRSVRHCLLRCHSIKCFKRVSKA
ncbi:hypothetical protein ElyMa_000247200 [Elysia marginata]|uniref:Uncharacterized protein n=1 Tax=Elysia marginata TaxID=1093978 RepID=A0AAV4F2E8_9GAST|nr:hypothetical protein ElyMa_000247200 [Elysia marginata]